MKSSSCVLDALPSMPACSMHASHVIYVVTDLRSSAGLCYLCVFFTWGALCVTKLGSSDGRASSVAVWGFVAAISTLVLVVQAAVQLLFFVGNDAWASDPETKEILELLGCPKALSGLDLFLVSHLSLFQPQHHAPHLVACNVYGEAMHCRIKSHARCSDVVMAA